MKIKTLVVDDSLIFRKLITEALGSFADIEVVASAGNGKLAISKVATNDINLVVLDVHMPEMDGVETLENLLKTHPNLLVVMISGISTRGANVTIKALELGAIDFIPKPSGSNYATNLLQLKKDLGSVLRLVKIRLNTGAIKNRTGNIVKSQVSAPKTTITKRKPLITIKPSIVAIGVSTGGPEALAKLIPNIKKSLSVPIVLVQHMPPVFTKSLADSLNRKSQLEVSEAKEGDILKAGNVYIAPGDRHIVIRKEGLKLVLGLSDAPEENSCKPAVDVLFRSVAASCGLDGVLSVVLTGMGQDGLNGVRALKRKKCYSLIQSPDSCVVYGMPRAINDAKLADEVIDIQNIASRIEEICL